MSIFAKVGVDLLDHQRVLRLPRSTRAACLGAWLVALVYTRKHELDGFCPGDIVEVIAGPEIVDWLVKVDLFATEEQDGVHGYHVQRYEQHNETKAEIDKRRRIDRKRKATRFPKGSHVESSATPVGFQTESARPPGSDSGSVSGSVSVGGPGGAQPPPRGGHNAANGSAANGVGHADAKGRPVTKARKTLLRADWKPSEALLEWAKTKENVEAAPLVESFVDHWLRKGEGCADWDAAFRTWVRNAVKFGDAKPAGVTAVYDIIDHGKRVTVKS